MSDFPLPLNQRRIIKPLPNHRGRHPQRRVNRAMPEATRMPSTAIPKTPAARNIFIAQQKFKNRIPLNLWKEALLAENPKAVFNKHAKGLYEDIMLDETLKGDFHEERVKAIIRDFKDRNCFKKKLEDQDVYFQYTIDDRVGGRMDFDHAKVDTIVIIGFDKVDRGLAFHQIPKDIDFIGIPIQIKSRDFGKEEHERKSTVPCIAVEGKSRQRIENELVNLVLDFQPPLNKDELGMSIRELVQVIKTKYKKIKQIKHY